MAHVDGGDGGAASRRPIVAGGVASIGWLPGLTLVGSAGLLAVAVSYALVGNGIAAAASLFWIGLLAIGAPIALRLAAPGPRLAERIGLVVVLGILLDLVHVLRSPTAFTDYDELLHLRTLSDILGSHHLFSPNPLLDVSPLFPGLEIGASGVSQTFGAGPVASGIVLLAAAHVLLSVALFGLYGEASDSARVGGLGAAIYLLNPNALFFDTQFAYESLAVTLVPVVLLLTARLARRGPEATPRQPGWQPRDRERTAERGPLPTLATLAAASAATARSWLPLFLAGLTLVVTHHVTSYVVAGLLVAWWLSHIALGRADAYAGRPIAVAAAVVVGAAAWWLVFVGPKVLPYLAGPLSQGYNELVRLVTAGQGRALFQSSTGAVASLWERLAGLAAAGLFVVVIPLGAVPLLHRLRGRSLAILLGLVALGYPASLIARLTPTGSEAGGRSLAFVFIGLAFVGALGIAWLTDLVTTRGADLPNRIRRFVAPLLRTTERAWGAALAGVVATVIVGATVIGTPPETRFPGPYLVVADRRSIDDQSTDAALWAAQILGPGASLAGDRINRLLMGALAGANVRFGASGVETWQVFMTPAVSAQDIARLRLAGVRYIVIDRRLSSALPLIPYYYEEGEIFNGPHTRPLAPNDLAKWDAAPGVNRIYDGGDVQVYDVGGLDGVR